MILPLLVEVTVLLEQKINEMLNKNFFSSCNKGKGLLIMKFLLKYKRIKGHDWQEENQS